MAPPAAAAAPKLFTRAELAALVEKVESAQDGRHIYTHTGSVYCVDLNQLMHPGGRQARRLVHPTVWGRAVAVGVGVGPPSRQTALPASSHSDVAAICTSSL